MRTSGSVNSGPTGYVGYQGIQGSVGPLPSGKCLRSRSLLAIFDHEEMTSGQGITVSPILIDGDCPFSAAILKVHTTSGFGGPLDDF
jgi:hypothetical protein